MANSVEKPAYAAKEPSLQAVEGNRTDYFSLVSRLIATVAVVVVVVLLGWTFHVEPMKRIAPGLTSMNPVTAVCFGLSCLVLWLFRKDRPGGLRGWIAGGMLLVILYIGVAKLIDLYSGSSLCPDALLFSSQLDYGQAYPSRMAPNVAASFVLLALAMLATDRPTWLRLPHPQWIVTPILCAALTALIGYAYDTSGFYKYRQFIPMALHSAVCFVLIATALILSRPDQGYLRLIPKGTPGAKSFVRLLLACVLIPAFLGGASLWATEHGWLSGRGAGTAVATVLTIFGLSILAFLNSAVLTRADRKGRAAKIQLEMLVQVLGMQNEELQQEIAERKRLEELAAYQATHDPLTDLPNRLLFVDRLQKSIARTVRHENCCALFYIDIDHFKPVNDRYGHQAGDELLKLLAERLRKTLREVDTVARLGGDEFAVIMDAPVNHEHSLGLAMRVSEAVRRPYTLSSMRPSTIEVTVGISLGIALFPGDATDLDGLVRMADSAMYQAKLDGKHHRRDVNIQFATTMAAHGAT